MSKSSALYAKRREVKALIKQAKKSRMTPVIDRYKMELNAIESELANTSAIIHKQRPVWNP